jgi:hypothetical protein
MKRVFLMLALAMLGLLAAAPAVQAAPSTAFTGEWTATDSGDGSDMHLIVGPGPLPQILFIDEEATGGVCDGQASEYFTSVVRGSVDGNSLDGTFIFAKCGHVTVFMRPFVRDFALSWTLQNDGTLVDGFGDTWSRV